MSKRRTAMNTDEHFEFGARLRDTALELNKARQLLWKHYGVNSPTASQCERAYRAVQKAMLKMENEAARDLGAGAPVIRMYQEQIVRGSVKAGHEAAVQET